MISAPTGPTEPAAGVIVARPAIVPVAMPTRVGFLKLTHSMSIQTKAAVAADVWVTIKARAALASAATADPALKPNQPTQSMAAPRKT